MKTLTRGFGERWSMVRSASVLLLILLPASSVRAQTPPAGAAAQPDATAQPVPVDPLGRSTPHGTVTGFVEAAAREDFARATEYLETRGRRASAEELARQLYVVLNRGLTTDLDRLSRSPDGNLQDGLPGARDRIGSVGTTSADVEIVVIRVQRQGQPPIWLFSADTLERIPAAADELSAVNLETYLPRALIETTILSQPLYRWIAVPLFLGLALLLGSVLARGLVPALRPILRRITGQQDDRTAATLGAPIQLILVSAAIRLFSALSLSLQTRQFWTRVAAAVAVIGTAWLVIRFSDIVAELGSRRLYQRQMQGRIAVLTLLRRLFKVAVVSIAALSLLYRAGLDLTAILTGLGIGGLGIALAAQKTLENLFGGVMIITDEPLCVGDFCRIADQMGTVEDIGLRSTRIRTLSRTVVAVPNGQLASMNIENFSRRDKFWLRHMIGVRYETSADQMRYLLARVRTVLYAHPKVERDGARIRFVGFGGSSLDLEIFAYVSATDMADFLAIQEDVLLRIMDIIAESGTSIAFPSQTTYLARDTPLDAGKTQEAESRVRQWRETGELPFPDFAPDQIGHLGGSVEYPPPGSAARSSRKTP